MNKQEKTIYNIGLHETLRPHEELFVTRVAGGWIYETVYQYQVNGVQTYTTVFVPYNEEFKINEVKQ